MIWVSSGVMHDDDGDPVAAQSQQPRLHWFPGIGFVFSEPAEEAREIVEKQNPNPLCETEIDNRFLRRKIAQIERCLLLVEKKFVAEKIQVVRN